MHHWFHLIHLIRANSSILKKNRLSFTLSVDVFSTRKNPYYSVLSFQMRLFTVCSPKQYLFHISFLVNWISTSGNSRIETMRRYPYVNIPHRPDQFLLADMKLKQVFALELEGKIDWFEFFREKRLWES